mmetsp:Transcript_25435/g.41478  ORF Transcript_25435/g.41478 Transcript_25435/m.41478 type:complete len:92 (+) Transcript_25435:419-694(+)
MAEYVDGNKIYKNKTRYNSSVNDNEMIVNKDDLVMTAFNPLSLLVACSVDLKTTNSLFIKENINNKRTVKDNNEVMIWERITTIQTECSEA